MLCPKCNKEIAEGLDFCTECGAQISVPQKSKDRKRKAIILGAVILVVLCAAAYFTGIFTPASVSAEDTAKAALEAYLEFDSERTLGLFPKKYTRWAADRFYGGDQSGFEDMLSEKAKENELYYETRYGTAWSYSDVIVSKVLEYSDTQIEGLNDDYDALGIGIKVNAAKKVKLKYTISYLNEDDRKVDESAEYTAFVIKIGAKWYLCDE